MATLWDKRRRVLVWGYIRQIEIMYKDMNIPHDINDIIYRYQQSCDIWSKRYSNPACEIDADGTNIRFDTDSDCTAFGEHVVESGIFIWRLRVIFMIYNYEMFIAHPYIGIVDCDEADLEDYRSTGSWDRIGYQLCAGNAGLFGHYQDVHETPQSYECKWNQRDDILEMILNLEERTLSFIVNGQDYGIAFSKIKQTKYRLALGVVNSKSSQFVLL